MMSKKDFLDDFHVNVEELEKLSHTELCSVLGTAFSTCHEHSGAIVKYFIKIKWDFKKDFYLKAPTFLLICHSGSLEAVKESLLDPSVHLRFVDIKFNTALHYACRGGNLDVVKFLLEQGLEIDERNKDGLPCLHDAVYANKLNVIEYLIEGKGYDINTKYGEGYPCIFFVKTIETLNRLVQLGANINAVNEIGNTVLQEALFSSDYSFCKRLLELNATPNGVCYDYGTCYEIAIQGNNYDQFKLLMDHNVNPNTDYHYECILFEIHRGLDIRIVEAMLTFDMDINRRYANMNNITPLMHVGLTGNTEQFELLLEHGADPYAKDPNGKSVFHYVAQGNSVELINLMLERFKIDPKIVDDEGKTILHLAAIGNNHQVIKFIIKDLKFEPNIRDNFGRTGLHDACEYKFHVKIIPVLIENGLDINAVDLKKRTALHLCSFHDNYTCVDILLNLKADPNILDFNFMLPIDLCSKPETFKAFRKYSIYKYPIISCFL